MRLKGENSGTGHGPKAAFTPARPEIWKRQKHLVARAGVGAAGQAFGVRLLQQHRGAIGKHFEGLCV